MSSVCTVAGWIRGWCWCVKIQCQNNWGFGQGCCDTFHVKLFIKIMGLIQPSLPSAFCSVSFQRESIMMLLKATLLLFTVANAAAANTRVSVDWIGASWWPDCREYAKFVWPLLSNTSTSPDFNSIVDFAFYPNQADTLTACTNNNTNPQTSYLCKIDHFEACTISNLGCIGGCDDDKKQRQLFQFLYCFEGLHVKALPNKVRLVANAVFIWNVRSALTAVFLFCVYFVQLVQLFLGLSWPILAQGDGTMCYQSWSWLCNDITVCLRRLTRIRTFQHFWCYY